jgi:hypothetical protein
VILDLYLAGDFLLGQVEFSLTLIWWVCKTLLIVAMIIVIDSAKDLRSQIASGRELKTKRNFTPRLEIG